MRSVFECTKNIAVVGQVAQFNLTTKSYSRRSGCAVQPDNENRGFLRALSTNFHDYVMESQLRSVCSIFERINNTSDLIVFRWVLVRSAEDRTFLLNQAEIVAIALKVIRYCVPNSSMSE